MDLLVFETALGCTAFARERKKRLARENEKVLALSFGHPSEIAAIRAIFLALGIEASPSKSSAEVESVLPGEDSLADRLRAFAQGEADSFDDLQIDVERLTPFARRVTSVCRKIPRGKTLTYGQVAQRAGSPGAARAVGSVMSRNRVPLIVPCHRVLAASGGLGGYSAAQGVSMKKRLLAMEQQEITMHA